MRYCKINSPITTTTWLEISYPVSHQEVLTVHAVPTGACNTHVNHGNGLMPYLTSGGLYLESIPTFLSVSLKEE